MAIGITGNKVPITLSRNLKRFQADKFKTEVRNLCFRALGSQLSKVWACRISNPRETTTEADGTTKITTDVIIDKVGGHSSAFDKQLQEILTRMIRIGNGKRFKDAPFKLESPFDVAQEKIEYAYDELINNGVISVGNGTTDDQPNFSMTGNPNATVERTYSEINVELGTHFDHIYGRKHQISLIHKSIVAARSSNWQNRFHCLLYGPPASAKSETLTSIGKMLGDEGVHYFKYDATTSTVAGISKILLDPNNPIPPVMLAEELEKTSEENLKYLLGILDHRAELRRLNARIGNQIRDVRMLCIATVNNVHHFKNLLSGAIASRFSQQIYFPRPTREILEKVLEREILKLPDGKMEWISPTLDFAEKLKITDPRRIIPICLCGKDALLDGSYQDDFLSCMAPEGQESLDN